MKCTSVHFTKTPLPIKLFKYKEIGSFLKRLECWWY